MPAAEQQGGWAARQSGSCRRPRLAPHQLLASRSLSLNSIGGSWRKSCRQAGWPEDSERDGAQLRLGAEKRSDLPGCTAALHCAPRSRENIWRASLTPKREISVQSSAHGSLPTPCAVSNLFISTESSITPVFRLAASPPLGPSRAVPAHPVQALLACGLPCKHLHYLDGRCHIYCAASEPRISPLHRPHDCCWHHNARLRAGGSR